MTNITINAKKATIEMNKTFAKAASAFGSEEYKQLQEARRDYPTFRVITKSAGKKGKDSYRGLNYNFMEKYIKLHDDDGSIMNEYKVLRALDRDSKEAGLVAVSYADMKDWFFDKFPEIEAFQKKREEILRGVEERKAAKKAAEEDKVA